ncbi:hypothetical protein EsVE80_16690 [Enterococcus saigonensis]|uniref:Uncharacterized protein n=1 Tax=Enterococcus saigonensis TaxID=1805431 RepID=A0A679ILJ5_9ENTE|nr:hypothetical protein [Enterococcus saigonensis]BCA86146.1 hypothetical protein EsVE80_16690 [Enterococcus saigonensis]
MHLSKEQTTRLLEQMDFVTFQEKVTQYFDGEEVDFSVYYLRNRKNGSILATMPKYVYASEEEGVGNRYIMGYASILWEQFAPVDKEDFVARHIKAFFDQNSYLPKNYQAMIADIALGAKYRFFLLEPLLRDLQTWAVKKAQALQNKKRYGSSILKELVHLPNNQFENLCIHHFVTEYHYNQLKLLLEDLPICFLNPDYELINYGYAVEFWLHYSGEDTSVNLEEELYAFTTSVLNNESNYHNRFLSTVSMRQELTEEVLLKVNDLINELEYWALRRLMRKVEI